MRVYVRAYVELFVESVVQNEIVRHTHAVRLHRMALSIVEVAHLRIIEVSNLFLFIHFVRSLWFACAAGMDAQNPRMGARTHQ